MTSDQSPRDVHEPADPETQLRDEHLRDLGLMLSAFAHELNTPLAAVASMADTMARCHDRLDAILSQPSLSSDDHQTLTGILGRMRAGAPAMRAGIDRARALVQELRLAGRPDESDVLEVVDLIDAIEGDLVLLKPLLRDGIEVERDYRSRPSVRGRPALIGQVFLNLMRNAVQAMDGAGRLIIEVDQRGGRAIVSVADEGPGVPEEVLGLLFREVVTTKGAADGTGLGLYLCQRVLARHHGAIEAANRPGGGAVFTVTLPVA